MNAAKQQEKNKANQSKQRRLKEHVRQDVSMSDRITSDESGIHFQSFPKQENELSLENFHLAHIKLETLLGELWYLKLDGKISNYADPELICIHIQQSGKLLILDARIDGSSSNDA